MLHLRIVILLFVLTAPAAHAAMVEVPLKAVTTRAAEIVQGEVISQSSDWDYGYRTIMTDVVILSSLRSQDSGFLKWILWQHRL